MFKRLGPDDYTVTPFRASRRIDVSYDASGAPPDAIDVLRGDFVEPPFTRRQLEAEGSRNPSGPYRKMVYDLVRHRYYSGATDYDRFGVEDYGGIDFGAWPPPSGRLTVVKVSPRSYGERIVPGTVRISFPDAGVSASLLASADLVDDGSGNLLAPDGALVGNVFYSNGLIVVLRESSSGDLSTTYFPRYALFEPGSGDFDLDGLRRFDLSFRNQVTHYEHEVRCEVLQREFRGTTNPTVLGPDGDPVPYASSLEFRPYITTVGLYDDQLNLVAVGKLARPLRKPEAHPLTIAVRFDT